LVSGQCQKGLQFVEVVNIDKVAVTSLKRIAFLVNQCSHGPWFAPWALRLRHGRTLMGGRLETARRSFAWRLAELMRHAWLKKKNE
jgi:hypothetical protein